MANGNGNQTNGKILEVGWDRIYSIVENMSRFKIKRLKFGNFEIERNGW